MARPFKDLDPTLLEQLTDHFSDKEIGEKLGHSRWTVTQARKRFKVKSFYQKTGLKRNVFGEAGVTLGGRKRSFTYNESFFKEVTTESQAYFLGLLSADGNISMDLTRIEIQLLVEDKSVLEKFQEAIGGTSSRLALRDYNKRKPMYRLALSSKRMVSDLVSWGITPRKTHTLKIEREISPSLIKHFLRGLWDGDGHIGEKQFGLLTASVAFADQIQEWFYSSTGIDFPYFLKKVRGNSYPCFQRASLKHAPLLRFMYKDSTYFMERKMIQFSRFWS